MNPIKQTAILDVGSGIIIGDGSALPGVDMQVTARLNTSIPIYAGGEIGTFLFSSDRHTAVVIPILATAFTLFDVSNRIHPVLGVSVGPTLQQVQILVQLDSLF